MSALVVMVISSWNKKTRPACEILCVVGGVGPKMSSPSLQPMILWLLLWRYSSSFGCPSREKEKTNLFLLFCVYLFFLLAVCCLSPTWWPFSVEDTHTRILLTWCVLCIFLNYFKFYAENKKKTGFQIVMSYYTCVSLLASFMKTTFIP